MAAGKYHQASPPATRLAARPRTSYVTVHPRAVCPRRFLRHTLPFPLVVPTSTCPSGCVERAGACHDISPVMLTCCGSARHMCRSRPTDAGQTAGGQTEMCGKGYDAAGRLNGGWSAEVGAVGTRSQTALSWPRTASSGTAGRIQGPTRALFAPIDMLPLRTAKLWRGPRWTILPCHSPHRMLRLSSFLPPSPPPQSICVRLLLMLLLPRLRRRSTAQRPSH